MKGPEERTAIYSRVSTMSSVTAMILAGGFGTRLLTLSNRRAKPAVPFGSNYRLIDFTMSNVMHSGIDHVGILTQYKPYSLNAHIGMGEAWGFSGRRAVAKVLPPYVGGKDSDWYGGTADAIYQNLSFVRRFGAETILILSGDHIYHMSYADMVDYHLSRNADLTIATQPVPWEETSRFGIIKFDDNGRVEAFQEKPQQTPVSNQANLGIYAFKRTVLEKYLRDFGSSNPNADFGKDIIPAMIQQCSCYAYEFPHYWRDVGTLQSFWEANFDCLNPASGLNLHQWRVRTNSEEDPFPYNLPLQIHGEGRIVNSIVGKGSCIRGSVSNSIIFRGVEIGKGAEVRNCILMDGTCVGPGAKISHLITDKMVRIGACVRAGLDPQDAPVNDRYPTYLNTGLTLIGKGTDIPPDYRVGNNCLINPDRTPGDFSGSELLSGTTLG